MLELVDSAGQSWGQAPPLTIPPGADFSNFLVELPAVIFTHYEGQGGSWTVDPTLQDADTATDEITVTNLIDEDVAVERCRSRRPPAGPPARPSAPSGREPTSSPSRRWRPRRRATTRPSSSTPQATPASHTSGILVQKSGTFGASCQMERILVHGRRAAFPYSPDPFTELAMSSCYGYQSGGI